MLVYKTELIALASYILSSEKKICKMFLCNSKQLESRQISTMPAEAFSSLKLCYIVNPTHFLEPDVNYKGHPIWALNRTT